MRISQSLSLSAVDPVRQRVSHRARFALALMGVGVLAAGCAGTSSVSDELTTAALEKSHSGVAVMKAEIVGTGCRNGGVVIIGRKTQEGYEVVRQLQTVKGGLTDSGDVIQVQLEPGDYHVVEAGCQYQQGRYVYAISLGKKQGGSLFGIGAKYTRSFAQFTVGAGEIVNVGYLKVQSSVFGGARLEILPIPEESLAKFRTDRPRLSAQMSERPMSVEKQAFDPGDQARVCDAVRKVLALSKKHGAQLPKACGDTFDEATAKPKT